MWEDQSIKSINDFLFKFEEILFCNLHSLITRETPSLTQQQKQKQNNLIQEQITFIHHHHHHSHTHMNNTNTNTYKQRENIWWSRILWNYRFPFCLIHFCLEKIILRIKILCCCCCYYCFLIYCQCVISSVRLFIFQKKSTTFIIIQTHEHIFDFTFLFSSSSLSSLFHFLYSQK